MPVFFSNFTIPVSSSGGDALHAVLQNATPNDFELILIAFNFNASISTFDARRFDAAATLTPTGSRPTIGCLDRVGAVPGGVVATAQSDTIVTNGAVNLSARVYDVTTQRSLFTPISIVVPADSCLAVYTVDQVGSRNVLFRLSWTEPR